MESNETTVIRIKRKRDDEPLNSLVIAAAVKNGSADKIDAIEHVFRRIDTVNLKVNGDQKAHIQRRVRHSFKRQHLNEPLENRKKHWASHQKSKRNHDLEQRRKLNGMVRGYADIKLSEKGGAKPVFHKRSKIKNHFQTGQVQTNDEEELDFVDVDLTDMLNPPNSPLIEKDKPHVDSPLKSPTKVLDPMQRRLDEAIFTAFHTAEAALLHHVVGTISKRDLHFSRVVDGTTPLMAAAWCGDLDLCRSLLQRGVSPSVCDVHGATASDLADRREHSVLAVMLREAMQDQDNSEFVFDIYCLDVRRTGQLQRRSGASPSCKVDLVEPLQLSRQELQALRQRAQFKDEGDSESDGLVNEDSDSWDDGLFEDDGDSNDEHCFRNDYPDEEEYEGSEGGWLPGNNQDVYDDEAFFGRSRSGSESDEEVERMQVADIWTPVDTSLPTRTGYESETD